MTHAVTSTDVLAALAEWPICESCGERRSELFGVIDEHGRYAQHCVDCWTPWAKRPDDLVTCWVRISPNRLEVFHKPPDDSDKTIVKFVYSKAFPQTIDWQNGSNIIKCFGCGEIITTVLSGINHGHYYCHPCARTLATG